MENVGHAKQRGTQCLYQQILRKNSGSPRAPLNAILKKERKHNLD